MSKYLLILIYLLIACQSKQEEKKYIVDENRFLIYMADLSQEQVKFFWKDDQGRVLNNFNALKKFVKKDSLDLLFACNGGMFLKNFHPQGLYIQEGAVLQTLDTLQKAYGNFYLQPNGVFGIFENREAFVSTTSNFQNSDQIKYATQSGPMLLVDGDYHPSIRKGSSNLHIRNGVGIMPDGNILFAMSKEKVNFYDLATLFKQKGCNQALYLDGFVSRAYYPEQGYYPADERFGVMIGVLKSE